MKKAFNYSVRTREILSLKFLLEEAGNKDEGLEVLILTLFPWQAQQMFRLARPSPILPTTKSTFYPYTSMNMGRDLYRRSDTIRVTPHLSSSWDLVKREQ